MILNLHPSAIDNYNNKALALIDKIEEIKSLPPTTPFSEVVNSERIPSFTLNQEDIIGDIKITATDYFGNVVSKQFSFEDKEYEITEDGYSSLKLIAERIQSDKNIKDLLGIDFIIDTLFDWVSKRFKRTEECTFMELLEIEAEKSISEFTIWIPVANLNIETPFSVCDSRIETLTKRIINKWEKQASQKEDNHQNVKDLYDGLRKKYQGYAFVVSKIRANSEHAFKVSTNKANVIISILAIYSPSMFKPNIKYSCSIKGNEAKNNSECIYFDGNSTLGYISRILDMQNVVPFILPKDYIEAIRDESLDKLSNIITNPNQTEFEESLSNSIFLYSKAAFTSEPIEKIVYVLSSLESLLLKSENEPIQQNLSERIAIFCIDSLSERKKIIRNIKNVYALRSKYLHHGKSSQELENTTKFLNTVWHFYYKLINLSDSFTSKNQMIEYIENLKLS